MEPGGQVAPNLLAGLELEDLVGEPLGLGGGDGREQGLDGRDEGRAHAEPAEPHAEEGEHRPGLAGHLAADGHGRPGAGVLVRTGPDGCLLAFSATNTVAVP